MFDLSPPVAAVLIGVLSGFLISIPVGPINITIINEGAQRGFRAAALIAFGAISMDVVYCAVAFAGFSSLFTTNLAKAGFELASFVAILYLGIKYLRAADLPETTRTVEMVEHGLHPHTAFMTGFVRVLGNPAVLLFWITLSATFIAHRWVQNTWASKMACVIGMAAGALSWFLLLGFVVSLGHGKFQKRTLVRMSHVSGAALLVVALAIGVRLVRMLASLRE